MASQFQMLGGVLGLVNSALAGLQVNNIALNYKAAIGWPAIKTLQAIAKGGPALVTVYDRKIGKNSTRWSPTVVSQTVVPATLTTSILPTKLAPGESATIVLGGIVTPGDAVSCLAVQLGANTGAVVAVGLAGDTSVTMAAKLARLINTDASMVGLLTATSLDSIVTLTAGTVAVGVQSYAGNGGTQEREIGRRDQSVQVVCWTRTVEQRNAMVAVIDVAIANSEINFGPTLADGSAARLSYVSDYDLEDDTLEDVYRHDFMISVDYPVTVTDALFAVLAPVVKVQVEFGGTWSLDFSDPNNSQYLPGLI